LANWLSFFRTVRRVGLALGGAGDGRIAMGSFLDDFRDMFPDHALDDWTLPANSGQEKYVALRYLPSAALLGSVNAAVADALGALSDLGTDLEDGLTAIDALVAVANVALSSDTENRALSRELVDLLLQIGNKNPRLARLVRAHAAVIHARAGDRTLALWRLNEYPIMPQAEGDLPGWWEDGAREALILAYAKSLLDIELPRATVAASLSVDIWRYLFGRYLPLEVEGGVDVTGEFDKIAEPIFEFALHDPERTFRSLLDALILAPAVTGFSDGLNQLAAPLLAQAEEMLWLVRSPRDLLWGKLALAAASLAEGDLAGRCIRSAFEAARISPPPRDVEHLDLAADLLLAQVLLNSAPVPATLPGPVLTEGTREPIPSDNREPFPNSLLEMLGRGNLVLIAGPELPIARGAPGRMSLLRSLVEQTDSSLVDADGRQQILASLAQGDLDLAARLLRSSHPGLVGQIAERYATPTVSPAYRLLAQLTFSSVISMSWDGQLLSAFADRYPVELNAGADAVMVAAKSQEFAFTWLAGDPSQGDIAISPRELRARLYNHDTLSRFLTGSVQSSSLLFVGVRARDVTDFFEALPAAPHVAMKCFAICEMDELWEFNCEQLREINVEAIGYDPGEADALLDVIERLAGHGRPAGAPARQFTSAASPMLSKVTLINIGPFDELDLELGDSWNLLLGNNGCGKSTVLRAVALGLCGDHTLAAEAGQSLLRADCDSGLIELQVGASRFRTELQRAPGTVRVRTSSLTPLQQGNWAVLGFPALRGMSVSTQTGIAHPQSPEPRVEDLLPLLRDEVDHRLDDIKQWIINVAARANELDGVRSRHMLDRFFKVIGELTPGIKLEFDAVDQESWEVWVRTDDGVVPIDRLSQGMNSIIAWVGTLLQRMYDIYGDREDPASETAFVLIDELDSHLHPAWQRLLPGLTRKHFPRVQLLATSHSPLVASSLQPGELFVAAREPRTLPDGTERLVATVAAVTVDPQGLRADQVLTSPLFGLMTSRSPEFGQRIDRYSQLMTAESRTPDEEAEMAQLRETIADSYLDGETAAERQAEARTDADLADAIADAEQNEANAEAVRTLADLLGQASEEEVQ
jgi:hypothetical protein